MASIRLLGGGIGARVTSTGSLGRAVEAGAASAGCKPPGFVRVGLVSRIAYLGDEFVDAAFACLSHP